jgi:hypothetical protein
VTPSPLPTRHIPPSNHDKDRAHGHSPGDLIAHSPHNSLQQYSSSSSNKCISLAVRTATCLNSWNSCLYSVCQLSQAGSRVPRSNLQTRMPPAWDVSYWLCYICCRKARTEPTELGTAAACTHCWPQADVLYSTTATAWPPLSPQTRPLPPAPPPTHMTQRLCPISCYPCLKLTCFCIPLVCNHCPPLPSPPPYSMPPQLSPPCRLPPPPPPGAHTHTWPGGILMSRGSSPLHSAVSHSSALPSPPTPCLLNTPPPTACLLNFPPLTNPPTPLQAAPPHPTHTLPPTPGLEVSS